MKPERDRHGILAGRVHADLDLQTPAAEPRLIAKLVPEREGLEQLGLLLAPAERGGERAGFLLGGVGIRVAGVQDLPCEPSADDPVDRQPARVEPHAAGVVRDLHVAPGGGVVEGGEPVGPGYSSGMPIVLPCSA